MRDSLGTLAIAAALLGAAPPAQAALTISGGATKNVSCVSGVCTATAKTAVLNKNDLETMLASSNVQVVPGSVAMDIVTESGLTWVSGNTLTLDAYRSITINQPVSVAGTGGLSITTDDGGSGGDYTFGPKGKVSFLSTSNSLTINGVAFTLLGGMSDVQAINANLTGNYALANSCNAKHVTNWIPLGTDGMGNVLEGDGFTGTFEGLGNTISNLTVNIGSHEYAGLFGLSTGATIRDVGIVGGTVTGGKFLGGLAGVASGTASGGGLIARAYSTANVGGSSGDSNVVGGLVGISSGTISLSYATGTVTGDSQVGGLVGSNLGSGAIIGSFATGTVTATVQNNDEKNPGAGGLVGDNGETRAMIENSYAMGAIPGTSNFRGGLVGYSHTEDVAIVNSYSTGLVGTGGSDVGGFLGCEVGGALTDNYWDTQTGGESQGYGCNANEPGITGLTTAQLQSGLPAGFDPTIWAENPSINNGFPYLIANPPPQ
jgi:hypothetical protein